MDPFGATEQLTDRLELGSREIHVWAVNVEVEDGIVSQLECVLSADERDRANRFRFKQLRTRYIAAHGVLRQIMARHIGQPAAVIRFRRGANGKPELAAPGDMRFNIAHSGSIAVFAFARDIELGIDVERIRPIEDWQAVARLCFHPDEYSELAALPVDTRQRAFFRAWTRKEALVKGLGEGLGLPLDQFCVGPFSARAHRLNCAGSGISGDWTVTDLRPARQYAAALAYRGPDCRITLLPHAAVCRSRKVNL
jgi:4'-phosphopantetheinyl transferase